MNRTFILSALLLTTLSIARAQDISGDWQGALDTGMGQLHLVLHVTKAPDGTLKATLDSVDQGANGIPVSSITLKDSKLNLDVTAVHGTYDGQVQPDGKTIKGTWSQGKPLPLDFVRAANSTKTEHKLAKPSDIDGAWMGTLDTGTAKLRVVFHIVNTEDGLTATIDSPDQGAEGLPTTSVKREGSTLTIDANGIKGNFEGTISPDLSTIDGKWTQGGGTLPLVLKRMKDQAELAPPKRPQNPVKPYPYRDEDVSYENKVQNVTLAASLTIPPGKGPFPGVVLITGSGPQDRDETLLGHKPFLVLSDYLTRHGIVVLRADDRGTGKSTGVFSAATTADFATDTEAGIAYLRTRPEVDSHKIGLIGHSEGGIIAPMIAARNKDVAFIVMMAGTGVPGDQVLVGQGEAIEIAGGKSKEEADKDAAKQREIVDLVETDTDKTDLDKKLRDRMTGEVPEAQIGMQIEQLTSPWFRYFLTYDPATALRHVTCPVLVLNGSLDKQVLPDQNLPAIRKALQEAGNKHFEIDELQGLNHLFQTAKTGSPLEYGQIEETISPVALEKIANWINATFP
jgi:uncharacterized protein